MQDTHLSTCSAAEQAAQFIDAVNDLRARYNEPPRLIRNAWVMLSEIILLLAQNYDEFRNYGEYMFLNTQEEHDGTYITKSSKAEFINNTLLLLGELPFDTAITYKNGIVGYREVESLDLKKTSNTREEQLECLELLVGKTWHNLNTKKMTLLKARVEIYKALEYLYWECPISRSIAMLWEVEPDISDPIFEEGRRIYYRNLFASQLDGSLADIMTFLRNSCNQFNVLLKSEDYKPARLPRPIKKRKNNGVLAGFNSNTASTRGIKGRPGPINPLKLYAGIELSKILDHIHESYPIDP